MRPAPHRNDDETSHPFDEVVADPISDEALALWMDTAKRNRDIYTEIFRPVPTNFVRNWEGYDVRFFFSTIFLFGRNGWMII